MNARTDGRLVLIVDRESTWVRRWLRANDRLIESQPVSGRHELACVPHAIWSDGEQLFTEVDGVVTTV